MLDDIVDKNNNTVHRTVKIKPIEVTDNYYAEYDEHPNKKILNQPKLIRRSFYY